MDIILKTPNLKSTQLQILLLTLRGSKKIKKIKPSNKK